MYRPPPPGSFSPSPYGGPPPLGIRPPVASTWQRPPPPLPPNTSVWKEHTTPEGRKYWYNNITRQSTWEKPDELLTPEEKVWKESAWKEYTTPEGKKYYSNSKTKQTVWELPADLKEKLEKAKTAINEKASIKPVMPILPSTSIRPPISASFVSETIPEFATKQEAEAAFFQLLKETGVKSDWSWEQAMRAIITKPLYRALKTAAERKAAFQSWAEAEAKREREAREAEEARLRKEFELVLQEHDIKPYTRYRTFIKLCGDQPAVKALSDRQREIYFDDYIQQLQRAEKDRLRDLRKENMEKFASLLKSIPEITYKTSWKEVQELYEDRKGDLQFEGMDMLDFFSVFEEYHRTLWEEPLRELEIKVQARKRKERKAREGFRELLHELVSNRKINVRTMWKEIHPLIKDDPRYITAVGLPDSTPLDMFWDIIDDLDEQFYHQKKMVYHALEKAQQEITLETSYEDYLKAVADVKVEPEENIKLIFDYLQSKAAQRIKDEKRRQAKRLRKKMDNFRHALKHAVKQPSIQIEDTWEIIKPRVEKLDEYKELDDDNLRKEVFEKFIKRLKVNSQKKKKKHTRTHIKVRLL
ncbi:uncharacterized protein BX663DRAFT_524529 [Cokeromyces recurvatus]|uniref:uncharacterized protein n=1 Tax=Cokeromyces recurvatus TaxID=90255 RepID=UPI00221FEFAC|nr:uncharacterized protein BX663DRAFT_524529 [Cokeromyces recurvatus]KAI7898550.1 hypothetical protein BX663DRAFT_524529 [Cokeromyces recurvatus]